MSPAELMSLTSALVDNVRNVSAAMNAAVTELIDSGWSEEQARELVHAMVVSGMRGKPAEPAEDEETAA